MTTLNGNTETSSNWNVEHRVLAGLGKAEKLKRKTMVIDRICQVTETSTNDYELKMSTETPSKDRALDMSSNWKI